MTEPIHRAPAFQFYADDFLAGTADMSAEEVGAYIRLLCHQWSKGAIPDDEERAGRIAGLVGSPSLRYVLAKFSPCEDGQLRNTRLERVRAESAEYRARQAESGRAGAAKRWTAKRTDGKPNGGAIATLLPTPMANGYPSDSSPSPSPTPTATEPPPRACATEPAADQPVELPPEFPKTEAAAQFASVTVGCPETFAAEEWHRAMSRGGRDARDVPIRSWASYLRTCWTHNQNRIAEDANRQRNASGNGGRGSGQPSASEQRNRHIMGGDAVREQALRTAEAERALAESGRTPWD